MAMVQWEVSIFEFISKIGIRIQKEMEIKIATMEYRKEGIAGPPITGWTVQPGARPLDCFDESAW